MTKIEQSIQVNVPVHVVYQQLTRFSDFPRFIEGVQEIRQLDNTHLHWRLKLNDQDEEWDSEITDDIPDRLIAWRHVSGKPLSGKVELESQAPDKTRVALTIEYEANSAALLGQSHHQSLAVRIEQNFARFKKFVEAHNSAPSSYDTESSENQAGIPLREAGTSQAMSGWANKPSEAENRQHGLRHESLAKDEHEPSWFPRFLGGWEDPLIAMRRISNEVDNLFERFVGKPFNLPVLTHFGSRNWTPPVEITRNPNQIIVCAELPGIKREDVQVKIQEDELTIEGDRHAQLNNATQEYRRTERAYGHFYRRIPLPKGINTDAATAAMHDGVLEITLPVNPPNQHVKHLNIRSTG
jgi:HSP20 family molecular chaperone IbpA/ribosome-associated toxin RatA of RatAB toxin-antitoxin module